MKIGSIDVTIPMLVYTAGVVAALIVLTIMWKYNSDIRYEAWHRGDILLALNGTEPDKGIAACEKLIAGRADRTNLRFALSELLYRQGRYQEAAAAYEALAALPAAKPEEKALALVGQGVSVFAAAPKGGQAKAVGQAEEIFRRALDQDKNCTDALVNLGLALAWKEADTDKPEEDAAKDVPKDAKVKKGESAAAKDTKGKKAEGGSAQDAKKAKKGESEALKEAGARCDQAIAAVAPPSLSAQTQLYALQGYVAMRRGQSLAATVAFEQVRALQPGGKDADALRRAALLGGIVQAGIEPQARRGLLARAETELGKFGKDNVTAMNVLGTGYSMLKGAPDFASTLYGRAEMYFRKALDGDVKDPRAYYGLASLLEDRAEELAKKVSMPLTGFTGETPSPNKWTGEAGGARFLKADNALVQEIAARLLDEEKLWQQFMDKTGAKGPERMDAQLRKLSCIRRRAYVALDDRIRLTTLATQAVPLAQEIAKTYPESAVAQYTCGRTLLDKEDYLGALKSFQAAEAAGMKSEELPRLLKVLGAKPEVLDVRPPENREKRWFGNRPLIGGTLRTFASAAGPFKSATVKMGETVLPPGAVSVVGSQVLFVPLPNQVVDGAQTVTISVTDAMGQTTEFPTFTLTIDKKPPTWTVTPDNSAAVATKPVFTITLADSSGIDHGTVRVALKKISGKGAGGDSRLLIENGKYMVQMSDTNPPRPPRFPLDADSFQVSPGLRELTIGDWELSVSAQDLVGNQLNEVKKYQVK